MNWLHTTVLVLHVLIAAAIVGLVLLQRGKGADAGAGFGAGASGTVFGARGSASFLSRTTATLATLFIATNLALAYMGGRKTEAPGSVVDRLPQQQQTNPAPALPEAPPATNTEGSRAPDSQPAQATATAPSEQPAPKPNN